MPTDRTCFKSVGPDRGTPARCSFAAAPHSQLEFLAGAQPADVVAPGWPEGLRVIEALDLRHDQVGLRGLGVRDVDREGPVLVDATQFVRKRLRRQVQAAPRQVL